MRLIDEVRSALADDPETGPPAGFAGLGDATVAAWQETAPEPRRAPEAEDPAPDAPCPTSRTYEALSAAYEHFNGDLFGGQLPNALITLQRKAKSYGFFAGERFADRSGDNITHEIALNPSHFRTRTTAEVLSTLVHEMCHLERHLEPGKPPRGGYHCKRWVAIMERVGLVPSSTGQPGGKQTGDKVSHYVEEGGAFKRSCQALIDAGFDLAYVEVWDEKKPKPKTSKQKFSCSGCEQNAWAKPEALLICGQCEEPMNPA